MALHNIYESQDYPFAYTALVGDANLKAYDRLWLDYNFAGYPSIFFDGGYRQFVSGTPTEAIFRSLIEQSGLHPVPAVDAVVSIDFLGGDIFEIRYRVAFNTPANQPPPNPASPSGISQGEPGISYEFESVAVDPENDSVFYFWDWGDGQTSGWQGPFAPGQTCKLSHTWPDEGSVQVRLMARDLWMSESDWSQTRTVNLSYGCCLVRGDINHSSAIDVSDLTFLVDYLFAGGEAPFCDDEADINASGGVDVSDLTFLVDYLFAGGPTPPSC